MSSCAYQPNAQTHSTHAIGGRHHGLRRPLPKVCLSICNLFLICSKLFVIWAEHVRSFTWSCYNAVLTSVLTVSDLVEQVLHMLELSNIGQHYTKITQQQLQFET